MNKWKIFMAVLMVIALLATFMVSCSSDEEEFDLKISVDPAATGTTSPAVGTHTYNEGDVITITATAASGYVFDSWTGDVADSSTASTTVTMDADQTVTANFVEVTYTLTMAVDPAGGGTTDPAAGTHDYAEGTVVDITATAEDGYEFDSWTGDVADTSDDTTTVTMDANQTVTANFVKEIITVDNTINEIIGFLEAEDSDLFVTCVGEDLYEQIPFAIVGSMTLAAVQTMPGAELLTDEIINCIAAGLAELQGEEPLTIDSPMEDIAAVEGGYELLSTCIGALVDTILTMAGEYSFPEALANPAAAGILTQDMQDCIEAGLADL